MGGFSYRLERRQRMWWRDDRSLAERLHRFREIHTGRSRHDPAEAWECCPFWQRKLINKWNAREFALRHGCRVPQLYWHGRLISGLPVDTLPEHFVIRPAWLQGSRGVRVVARDRELLSGRTIDRRRLASEIRGRVARISWMPYLAEEFVRTESGEYALPLDYKFFMFGETVGAIVVVERLNRREWRNVSYTADWEPTLEPILTPDHPYANLLPAPRCLTEMIHYARTLGGAYGSFVRVDLYATDHGSVFGEFCCAPASGIFTAYAESLFDRLWEEAFGDAV